MLGVHGDTVWEVSLGPLLVSEPWRPPRVPTRVASGSENNAGFSLAHQNLSTNKASLAAHDAPQRRWQ